MQFDHPEYDASFEIDNPEEWTVKQVLDYDTAIETLQGLGMYERFWSAAQILIYNWDCDFVSINADFDEVMEGKDEKPPEGFLESIRNTFVKDDSSRGKSAVKAAEVIKWAGLAVFSARRSLDGDEKN